MGLAISEVNDFHMLLNIIMKNCNDLTEANQQMKYLFRIIEQCNTFSILKSVYDSNLMDRTKFKEVMMPGLTQRFMDVVDINSDELHYLYFEDGRNDHEAFMSNVSMLIEVLSRECELRSNANNEVYKNDNVERIIILEKEEWELISDYAIKAKFIARVSV